MIRTLLPLLGVLVAWPWADREGHRTTAPTSFPFHVPPTNISEVCLEIASSVSEASEVFFKGPRFCGGWNIINTHRQQEQDRTREPLATLRVRVPKRLHVLLNLVQQKTLALL